MIRKITLKNFQSHAKTKLQLTPGVNIIVGSTDSGKSAIVRALRWVLTNKPTGDAFRSHWGGGTSVSVTTTEGDTVTRYKKKTNGYSLRTTKKKMPSLFEAIGTEVPKEIKDVLNLNSVNLQSQLDTPFLLSESSGEVARHFNEIAHIDKIDSSLKKVESFVRSSNQKVMLQKDLIKLAEERVQSFSYLPNLEQDVKKGESLQLLIQKKRKERQQLILLLKKIKAYKTQLKEFEGIERTEKDVLRCLSLFKDIQEQENKRDSLKALIKPLKIAARRQKEIEAYAQESPYIQEALSTFAKLSQKKKEKKALHSIYWEMQRKEKERKIQVGKLAKAEEDLRKSMPNICPLCGTNLQENGN